MKCFSEKNDSCLSCGFTTCDVKYLYFLLVQIFSNIWNKALGRFQLQAPRDYNCKWILGLCECVTCSYQEIADSGSGSNNYHGKAEREGWKMTEGMFIAAM